MTDRSTGRPLGRVNGRLKATGQALHTGDMTPDGLLHAVVLQSTIAKDQIEESDIRAAESMPGVIAVTTHRNAHMRFADHTGS